MDRIIAEVGRGEVVFPTHADVAIRVRLALENPDLNLGDAAQLVQAEPFLAARVVALANSVVFNRGGPVSDVRNAIGRLGIRFVKALATAVVMRQMAGNSQSPECQLLSERLWEHSAHVAALANVLALRFMRPLADRALFAGMVHEVGNFYLISRVDAYPDLFADPGMLSLQTEMTLGRAVLKALAVPDEVVDAVEALWQPRPINFPPSGLPDFLALANRLTPILSPLQRGETTSQSDVSDTASLPGEILEESAEDMEALTKALLY
ncbi:MAG: HDOD domain-containing protein [Dechloromonas sp.]|uniref:HDOD domain-containing protein n=1 Tax=Candidatus Dechloromonas phosphorivorans TaxID=2899244 RepID=A0A9D7LPW3_9RHOO|nr:HDOD domain-containing protein [Candidatus Dechloromonas phosphorivorans]